MFISSSWKKTFNTSLSLLMIVLMLMLSACSTMTNQNNAQSAANDIPDAIPKNEPLSSSGNTTYRVHGHQYHVLKSSKHYEEHGYASWYGREFHRQRTSSGERYNMLAMTAAHKTLPIPSYVLVTNLKNHKQAIVKINDRGPFGHHRIIDLSYVAAKKIGITGSGTALVDVKAIDPDEYNRNKLAAHHLS